LLRIIGGYLRGRRLKGPPKGTARPTSDRVREALFNILSPWVPGCRFLDLFAGSGAVGLEALSRGAVRTVFVEADPRVAAVLRANLSASAPDAGWDVYRVPFMQALRDLAAKGESFDLVFIDPPYGRGLEEAALRALSDLRLLAPGGIAVAESARAHLPPDEIPGLSLWRRERYGDTVLSFYRRADGGGREDVH